METIDTRAKLVGGEGRKNKASGDREEITAAPLAPPGWGVYVCMCVCVMETGGGGRGHICATPA